ncbi:hypothetical protein Daesc_000212 [Daldinia eschscholtzii]|uniref:Uncharacterized protein n=1 Tax=Daldinia eschscholtzii TaxID=292717 RepID=A0AAX6MYE4_9PEZI
MELSSASYRCLLKMKPCARLATHPEELIALGTLAKGARHAAPHSCWFSFMGVAQQIGRVYAEAA